MAGSFQKMAVFVICAEIEAHFFYIIVDCKTINYLQDYKQVVFVLIVGKLISCNKVI